MPGLNGYETCRQLKLRDAGSSTPVIFVSAHDTAPERVAAYEAGGDDFVTKPIAVVLFETVGTARTQHVA